MRSTGRNGGDASEADRQRNSDNYVLFDCPGQVELFTHHDTLPKLFWRLEKLGYRVRLYFPTRKLTTC